MQQHPIGNPPVLPNAPQQQQGFPPQHAATMTPENQAHAAGNPINAPRPRQGRFRRFVRGYLMLVGALTTLYVLVLLLVRLFVEVGKWTPALPIG